MKTYKDLIENGGCSGIRCSECPFRSDYVEYSGCSLNGIIGKEERLNLVTHNFIVQREARRLLSIENILKIEKELKE